MKHSALVALSAACLLAATRPAAAQAQKSDSVVKVSAKADRAEDGNQTVTARYGPGKARISARRWAPRCSTHGSSRRRPLFWRMSPKGPALARPLGSSGFTRTQLAGEHTEALHDEAVAFSPEDG